MKNTEQSDLQPKVVLESIKRPRGKVFPFVSTSRFAAFALFLGLLSLVCTVICIVCTYNAGGNASVQYTAAFVLCLFMAVAGIVFDILSRRDDEEDIAVFWISLVINLAVVAFGVVILYLGTGPEF